MKAKTLLRWGIALAMVASIAAVAGCAPSVSDAASAEKGASSSSGLVSGIPETDPMQPVIKKLSDGTLIQRTPTEDISATWSADAMWHHPDEDENVPANTYYTNADARGCNACHEDLAATLDNALYDHHSLTNEYYGMEITLQSCIQCHRYQGGTTVQTVNGEFGTLIHGVHMDVETECWNCHDASGNTEGEMVLWDLVKHNKLRGIEDVSSDQLSDNFSWNQDEITPADQLFDATWLAYESDYTRYHNAYADEEVPLDQEMFDTWEFSVFGEVENEMTWTLPDLIAEAEAAGQVDTFLIKYICNANSTNGPYVGQVEATGIKVTWLLDQAGVKDGAEWIAAYMPEGPFGGGDYLEDVYDEDKLMYLVYEMNGEPLTWANGYPCMYMRGDESAYQDIKMCTGIGVHSGQKTRDFNGWTYNNPSVGIFHLKEGQIIKTGETLTLEGYVDSFNREIVALEFSMDRGKTWKTFEIEGSDVNRLITWQYEFTPEEDRAYCIAVRGVNEDGLVTQEYVEKMVVAKSEIPVVE